MSLRLLFFLVALSAGPSAYGSDSLRVRIFALHTPDAVEARVAEATLRVEAHGVAAYELPPDETLTLRKAGRRVHLSSSGSEGFSADSVRLSTWAYGHVDLAYTRNRATTIRGYRGDLTIRVDAEGDLLVVNRIHIEDYVASVVPAEFSFPYLEGTKVQAVAARTYAVLTKNRQRSAGAPYDLADHEASQRYDGIGKENGDSRRATRETLGQIITYRGEPAEAVYHASCGGHTAANKDVWSGGRPLPYLQAKKDPYEQMSPHKSWIKRVRQQRVHAALAGHAGGAITRIAPAARSQDGRVRTLTLTRSDGQTVQIPGDVFRRLVNAGTNRLLLRSTFFDVDAEGDLYVFAGRGFGHGVGMCQWGTAEQARRGRSYQDILSFYYPGTKLTKATRGTPTAVALLDKPAYVPPSRTADDLASNTPRLDEAGPHSDTLRRANRPGSTDPVEVKRKRKRVGW